MKNLKKNRYTLVEAAEGKSEHKIEKIIAPEELSEIKIGIADETILELDSYLVDNKYIITVDNDGDSDDGVIISPVVEDNEKDPEELKEILMKIIKDALGDTIDSVVDEDEDIEDQESQDASEVEERDDNDEEEIEDDEDDTIEESLESELEESEQDENSSLTEEDDSIDEDEGDLDESMNESAEGVEDLLNDSDSEDDEGDNDDGDLSLDDEDIEVEIIENEDGSIYAKGDPHSLLVRFVGEDNADEIMSDIGNEKLDTDPTMKIESLLRKVNINKKVKNLL